MIPVAKPFLNASETTAVKKVVESGWITMGKKVELFEKRFCKKFKVKYAVAVNNGTSALHLAIKSMNLRKGDEVIIPNITFISTINVLLYEGLTPVLVDCCPKNMNICFYKIKEKISKKTKAMICVDMNGLPSDYDKIKVFCKKYNLKLIADSAESIGAKYKGNVIGSQAQVHIFSFFANKNITTGEGGMITTSSKSIYKKLKILRNQGQLKRYQHIMLGYNYRMTNIAAAIGLEQLKKVDKIVRYKNKIALKYLKAFQNNKNIRVPIDTNYSFSHSWYNFTLRFKNKKVRNKIKKVLNKEKIETRISFPPLHNQSFIKNKFKYKYNEFRLSNKIIDTILNIPIYYNLKKKEQEKIIKTINQNLD